MEWGGLWAFIGSCVKDGIYLEAKGFGHGGRRDGVGRKGGRKRRLSVHR